MADTSKHRSALSTDIETALHRMRALFVAIAAVAEDKSCLDYETRVIDLASMGEAIAGDQLVDMRTDTAES